MNENILFLKTEMLLDFDNYTLKTQIVCTTISLWAGGCGKTLFVTVPPFALRICREGEKIKTSFGNFLYILTQLLLRSSEWLLSWSWQSSQILPKIVSEAVFRATWEKTEEGMRDGQQGVGQAWAGPPAHFLGGLSNLFVFIYIPHLITDFMKWKAIIILKK